MADPASRALQIQFAPEVRRQLDHATAPAVEASTRSAQDYLGARIADMQRSLVAAEAQAYAQGNVLGPLRYDYDLGTDGSWRASVTADFIPASDS